MGSIAQITRRASTRPVALFEAWRVFAFRKLLHGALQGISDINRVHWLCLIWFEGKTHSGIRRIPCSARRQHPRDVFGSRRGRALGDRPLATIGPMRGRPVKAQGEISRRSRCARRATREGGGF